MTLPFYLFLERSLNECVFKKRKQNQYDTTNWDNSDDGNGGITGKKSTTEKDTL